jgi:hypothetical protein
MALVGSHSETVAIVEVHAVVAVAVVAVAGNEMLCNAHVLHSQLVLSCALRLSAVQLSAAVVDTVAEPDSAFATEARDLCAEKCPCHLHMEPEACEDVALGFLDTEHFQRRLSRPGSTNRISDNSVLPPAHHHLNKQV